jgi:hypothetical protein
MARLVGDAQSGKAKVQRLAAGGRQRLRNFRPLAPSAP